MGREVKRVPIDFAHPLKEIWTGYRMPTELRLPDCTACGGRGYSRRALMLFDLWYGDLPFQPEQNGSTPLTIDSPPVRMYAERNVNRAPEFYGRGEYAIRREARRLADLWNSQWSHHLNEDDVAVLVEAGRLHDLTHTWVKGDGWQPKVPAVVPTPEQVNTWAIVTPFGHDAINASVVVRARCQREQENELCAACGGKGDHATDEQRAAYEAWESTEPPTGDGWQLWETVSEGSPISPVFASDEGLARWMTENHCTVSGPMRDLESALRFVRAGWAPSMVVSPEAGVVDGVTWVGDAR